MDALRRDFRTRAREVRAYVRMLRFVDERGACLEGAGAKLPLDVPLFRVMKAGVFLHLYNLVEATVTQSLRRVSEAIRDEGATYDKLAERWRKAWLREKVAANESPDKRLKSMMEVCDHLIAGLVVDFVPRISTGNLDDRHIEDLAKDYGVELAIRPSVKRLVKHEVLDSAGALGLIRLKRNSLAHGLESFSDCGGKYSVADIRRFTVVTILYLEDVIDSFEAFLRARRFAA